MDRPILFSAPMVRAILAGTKTQTRRLLKVQPMDRPHFGQASLNRSMTRPVCYAMWDTKAADGSTCCICPYGIPGDRLWVREAFAIDDNGHDEWPVFRADGVAPPTLPASRGPSRWTPSIHMPRWASRITLDITGVRVERLHDISEWDAMAEGAPCVDEASGREVLFPGACKAGSYRLGFRALWENINVPGSWDANPWVWVIEFKLDLAAKKEQPK